VIKCDIEFIKKLMNPIKVICSGFFISNTFESLEWINTDWTRVVEKIFLKIFGSEEKRM